MPLEDYGFSKKFGWLNDRVKSIISERNPAGVNLRRK